MKKIITGAYFTLICAYALFSFSLTDPNLVLASWNPYWNFQQFMWQTFFVNELFLTQVFVTLVILLFGCYFYLFFISPQRKFNRPLLVLVLFILPLFLSYNALSHDVFNYIFNAKMVAVYHANPHQQVALDFRQDEWTRFMHNTNTPAPYGYLWTVISLVPFMIGFGKFTFTWLLFRLLSIGGLGLLILSYKELGKTERHQNTELWPAILLVFFNPLFLIEVVSNSHNDLWMMAPALLSLAILHQANSLNTKKVFFSLLLLGCSISIKLSTLVLIPVWIAVFTEQMLSNYQLPKLIKKLSSFVHHHYADISVLLLFVPLLTPRSQQFNPWYLIWLLVWIPFLRWTWLRNALLVLSVSSMLRYIPWLLAGGYSETIVFQQKMITFIPLIIYLLSLVLKEVLTRNSLSSRVE